MDLIRKIVVSSQILLVFSILVGLGEILLAAEPKAAPKTPLIFYEIAELDARRTRTAPKIKARFQSLIAPSGPKHLRLAAKTAKLTFPLRPQSVNPLAFYSFPGNKRIVVPMASIQFFDDLCIAYAWLLENGHGFDSVIAYLAALKYNNRAIVQNGRFPPPLKALNIPKGALNNPRVASLTDKIFGSAIVWILAHELGHVVYRHPGYDSVSREVARTLESQADAFANTTMRNIGVPPIGIVHFFLSVLAMDANRQDYASDDDWKRYIVHQRTHPLSATRLAAIALELRQRPRDFLRHESQAGVEKIFTSALQIEQIGILSDDVHIHKTIKLMGINSTPQTLRPGRSNSIFQAIIKPRAR